jgi:hypothetical protein
MASSVSATTATFGTGATAGDTAILIVETANQSIATPSGFTLVDNPGVGTAGAAGATNLLVYRKVNISSTDISSGVSISDSGDHQNAILLTYSGLDGTTPMVRTMAGTAGSATTSVSLTTAFGTSAVGANDKALALIATDRDSATVSTNSAATWNNISGSNSFIANFSSATGFGGGIIVNELSPSGAETSAVTFSCTITSSIWAGIVLVLKSTAADPNAISGSSSLAFSPSATLLGSGSIGGSSTLTITDSATLLGKGAVSGSAVLSFTPSGALVDRISGSSSLALSSSSTLLGTGSVTGSGSLSLSPAGTLLGAGQITGSSSLAFSGSGAISAPTISGSATLSFTPTATLLGRGAVTGSSSLSLTVSATVAGKGAVSGSSALAFTGSGSANGLGALLGSTGLSLVLSGTLSSIAPNNLQGIVTFSLIMRGQVQDGPAIGLAALDQKLRRRGGSWKEWRRAKR